MSTIFCCLKELLEYEKISVAQFAKQTGLAYNTVKRLTENNFTSIELNTIEVICNALDCTPGDFLRRKSEAGKSWMTDVELLEIFTELNIKHQERLKSEWIESTTQVLLQSLDSLREAIMSKQLEINQNYSQEILKIAKTHVESSMEYLLKPAKFD